MNVAKLIGAVKVFAKPRIRVSGIGREPGGPWRRRWSCGCNGDGRIGSGYTPAEAYASWTGLVREWKDPERMRCGGCGQFDALCNCHD